MMQNICPLLAEQTHFIYHAHFIEWKGKEPGHKNKQHKTIDMNDEWINDEHF